MAAFPLDGVEILYPIQPEPVVNKELHRQDNKRWKRVVKSSVNQLYGTLKLRVESDYMASLLSFIKSNKGLVMQLDTPGIYPFGNNYTSSDVYCLGHSKYYRESQTRFRIDVSFLQVAGIA